MVFFFFFQAEDGIRDKLVTGVQTCALPICLTVGDGGAEDDGERGDDDGRAMHTGPPGLGKRLRGDGRVVAPGRVECQGRRRRPCGRRRADARSEERRGGKECRSRWSPYY